MLAALACLIARQAFGAPPDAPLSGAPGSTDVDAARAKIDRGDFEEAVRALEKALREPELSDDTLVEIYRLLGLAELYLGDEEKARDAYEKLLQARPDFELPRSAPPKIRELYDRILRDIRQRRVRPVTITAEPLGEAPGDADVPVEARIEDLPIGAKAKLYYRRFGAQAYSSVDLVREKGSRDHFRTALPAYAAPSEARPYEVEYYLEVADAARRRLAGRGDPFAPLTFTVRGRAPVSDGRAAPQWYANPWIWVAGGAVAAGAVAGIVVVATQRHTGEVTIIISVSGVAP